MKMKWDYEDDNPDLFDYLDNEDSHLLITNNDSPTFLPPHLPDYRAILDLILISSSLLSNLKSFETYTALSSDHIPISIDLRFGQDFEVSKKTKKLNIDKLFSSLNLNSQLLTQDDIYNCSDIDKAVKSLTSCIQKSIDEATSEIRIREDNSYFILPKFIRGLIKEKNKARKMFQKSRNKEYKTLFNSLNNRVKENWTESLIQIFSISGYS